MRKLLVPVGGAALSVALVLAGWPVAAVPAGLLLALVLPGTALVTALFPPGRVKGGLSPVERYVLTVALSLAVLVLGGLGMYAAGLTLHRAAWAGLTGGVTVLAALAGYLRGRRHAAPAPRRVARARLVPLVLAAVLLTGAGWVSLASAARQSSATHVTALSIMDVSDTDYTNRTHTVTFEVTNQEGRAVSYSLRVTGPGGYVASLGASASRTSPWRVTLTVPASDRVTANLYRTGDSEPYRTVYVHGSEAAQ
ncbi:MAG TPA: DUF1616 domain-containing protein [Rugosimonospora sp.]|nr:DUF1616 domain-containing protein [Rugosimonospora sp.]